MRLRDLFHSLIFVGSAATFLTLPAVAQTPYLIGVSAPLSGHNAEMGLSFQRGVELAIDRINRGISVKQRRYQMIVEDNKGDSKQAAIAAKRLAAASVDIYFVAGSDEAEATESVTSKAQKLLLYTGEEPSLAERTPLVFRDFIDISADAATLSRVAKASGAKKVVYLKERNWGCGAHESVFKEAAKNAELEVAWSANLGSTHAELVQIITKAIHLRPDLLVACAWTQSEQLIKTMKELGQQGLPVYFSVPAFINSGDTIEVRKLYEENGSIATAPYLKLDGGFVRLFFSRYHSIPDAVSIFAFDQMMALAFSLKGCSDATKVDAVCVSAKLQDNPFAGLGGGVLKYGKARVSNRGVFAVRVVGGRWQEVPDTSVPEETLQILLGK